MKDQNKNENASNPPATSSEAVVDEDDTQLQTDGDDDCEDGRK